MLLNQEAKVIDGEDVSILTRPEGRVLPAIKFDLTIPDWFQSSPDPKAGCYVTQTSYMFWSLVSILTRPEGRVLLVSIVSLLIEGPVSILTRPEGRVLQLTDHMGVINILFQSSPDPKAGCYSG